MSLTTYLIFYGALVVLLVYLFIKQRKLPSPSSLNLKRPRGLQGSNDHLPNEGGARDLTIYFNYNGETMEAHEVLGIPAGAPVDIAEVAYKNESGNDPNRRDVFKHAIEAIRQTRN